MTTDSEMPVIIVGAGLGGLTLARALLKRQIKSVVLEKGPQGQSPGHGITLQSSSYNSLCDLLGQSKQSLAKKTAVDCELGGEGRVSGSAKIDARTGSKHTQSGEVLVRLNKRRLRDVLSEGLDIRYDTKLKTVETRDGSIKADLESGESIDGRILVASDGVHSGVRKQFLPQAKLRILPVVAINGSKRVKPDEYNRTYAQMFEDSTAITSEVDNVGLSIALNDATDQHVTISWTYTRPAGADDALFTPDRPLQDAKDIPNEFFEELAKFGQLAWPLGQLLSPNSAKKDKLYTWLMRSFTLTDEDISSIPEGVALIGDAVHAMPIVAGEGGNHTIDDAIQLADAIDAPDFSFASFAHKRRSDWLRGVQRSEANLAQLSNAKL